MIDYGDLLTAVSPVIVSGGIILFIMKMINERIDDVNRNVADMDKRFDDVYKKQEARTLIKDLTDKRFEHIEKRLDKIDAKLDIITNHILNK